MNALDDEKNALRTMVRKKRAAFVRKLPQAVSHLVFSRPPGPLWNQISDNEIYALYTPTKNEPPTKGYAQFLVEQGKQIALPRFSSRDAAMTFAIWNGMDETLEAGPFGVPQPQVHAPTCEPQIYFVPLLAFDDALNRLGQGGGHYDRYFGMRPDGVRIGLGWSVQYVANIPTNAHDVPLDAVITQSQFFVARPMETP